MWLYLKLIKKTWFAESYRHSLIRYNKILIIQLKKISDVGIFKISFHVNYIGNKMDMPVVL